MSRRSIVEVAILIVVGSAVLGAMQLVPSLPKVKVGADRWTIAWGVAPEDAVSGGAPVRATFPDSRAHDQSVRALLVVEAGGRAIRLRLSNEYGDGPLVLDHVTAAIAGPRLAVNHRHDVEFQGSAAVTVPAGAERLSDPVALPVAAGQSVAVSLAVRGDSPLVTTHADVGVRSGVSRPGSGDHAGDAGGGAFSAQSSAVYWLAGVEVLDRPGTTSAVVALGDDVTEAGAGGSWVEDLQARLPEGMAMIDEALASNQAGGECPMCGEPMDQRVIRDAVDLPGVKAAVVLGGSNDLLAGAPAATVIHDLASIAAILHVHGLRAIGLTIPPRAGLTTARQDARAAVNGWLRGSHAFDAVVDADRLLAAPGDQRLAAGYDAGDGVHLSAAGRRALADAVPVSALA